MGDANKHKEASPEPGGPDVQTGTPGGKVGPRGKVEVPAPGGQAAHEPQTFKGEGAPDPNDLPGPAGDPAEGKRPDTWPA